MAKRIRSGAVDLVRIAGVQIGIDFSWVIIFLLVFWSLTAGYFPQEYPRFGWGAYLLVGTLATVLFFASIIAHELAHALMANHLGQTVRRITLFIFGGVSQLSEEPRDPSTEMKIAAVGPLTSFALGGLFAAAAWLVPPAVPPLWPALLRYLAMINVALAVFNLLPGFPLDGGRLARAILWRHTGDLRAATARAADWGNGIAVGLMVLGTLEILAGALVGGVWLILIGLFLRGAARAGYQGMLLEQALNRAHVRDIMVDPVVVAPDLPAAEAIDHYFLRYGYGGFPVAENGHLEGLVSLAQVRQCPPEARRQRRVRDLMQPIEPGLRIRPDASVSEALRQMTDADTGRLAVAENGHLVGLITRSGIMRFARTMQQLGEGPGQAAA